MEVTGRFEYGIHSPEFVERAQAALRAFDEKADAQQIFLAALMLRFGIEARLFEYIGAALPPETARAQMKAVSEYTAAALLKRLVRENPAADVPYTVTFHLSEDGSAVHALDYKPIPQSLASLHGRLGELLHFNYFARNANWSRAERAGTRSDTTLLDARDRIARGLSELADVASGRLLGPPRVRQIVNEILEEARGTSPAPDLPTEGTEDDPGSA